MFVDKLTKNLKVKDFLNDRYRNCVLEHNPRDMGHISINDSRESLIFRGKSLKREKTLEGSKISICNFDDIKLSNLICFGEQGFDTFKHHSALLRSVETQTMSSSPDDLLKKE